MKRITEELKEGKILVSDGAWGTQLYKKGLKIGECPETWCLVRFDECVDIAKNYIQDGADMVKTNSFGGSRIKLAHFGLDGQTEAINEAAARASRLAAGEGRHVLASVGPTGKFVFAGDIAPEELYDVFSQQVRVLEKGGADTILVETMSDTEEAAMAVRAAREYTRCEVACTFTFEKNTRGEYRTIMGATPAEAARAALEAGAHIVGTNCGNGVERMVEIVRELRAAVPDAPILVHANAGMPIPSDDGDAYPETPEFMASFVHDLIRAGANVVGGCCGTTPAHIAAIRKAVEAFPAR